VLGGCALERREIVAGSGALAGLKGSRGGCSGMAGR
jgi:hypothetical protein